MIREVQRVEKTGIGTNFAPVHAIQERVGKLFTELIE